MTKYPNGFYWIKLGHQWIVAEVLWGGFWWHTWNGPWGAERLMENGISIGPRIPTPEEYEVSAKASVLQQEITDDIFPIVENQRIPPGTIEMRDQKTGALLAKITGIGDDPQTAADLASHVVRSTL